MKSDDRTEEPTQKAHETVSQHNVRICTYLQAANCSTSIAWFKFKLHFLLQKLPYRKYMYRISYSVFQYAMLSICSSWEGDPMFLVMKDERFKNKDFSLSHDSNNLNILKFTLYNKYLMLAENKLSGNIIKIEYLSNRFGQTCSSSEYFIVT